MFEKVSFIIPVYNEEDFIGATIRSIHYHIGNSFSYEIIAVDNGSKDRSKNIIEGLNCTLYIKESVNVGCVRNFGAEKASGDFLVFLDADCEIDWAWTKKIESILKNNREDFVVGGGIKLPKDFKKIEKNWLLPDSKERNVPKRLVGACILTPKKSFIKAGMFDETVTSGEDTDFHSRAEKIGIPVIMEPELSVVHNGNAKTVSQFINRQLWHSENYIKHLKTSIFDPIFLLVNLFVFSIIILMLAVLTSNLYGAMLSAMILVTLPLVLSIKRIIRSKNIKGCSFIYIYILDLLYLVGRSLGYLKGLTKK